MTAVAGFGLEGRVLVRTTRCRTRRDRVRVRDALDGLDSDTGLPRSAVLVVRRLQGTLVGNPARLDGVVLRTVAATAHRASSAPPPADCDAVLFADEAELLTSLCRDLAHHRPLGWWWRTVLRSTIVTGPQDFTAAATVGLSRWARALPAATARAPRAVAAAASLLPDVDLLRVIGAMADTHGAHPTGEVLRDAWQHAVANGRTAAGEGPGPVFGSSGSVPSSDTGRVGPPEARERLAALAAGLPVPPLVAVLVDTALQLHRDPVGARSAAAAVVTATRLPLGPQTEDVSQGGPALTVSTHATDDDRGTRARPATGRPGPPDTAVEPGAPPAAAPPDAAGAGGRLEPAAHGRDDAAADAGARREDETDTHEPGGRPEDLDLVDTGLGGAFYLLNLLESVDLPDSADGPGEPGGSLNRWGVLALVLRRWPDVNLDDPLFTVLADLAWPGQPGPFGCSDRNEHGWAYRRPRTAGFPSRGSGLRWWRDDSSGRIVVFDPMLAADPVTAGSAVVADLPDGSDPQAVPVLVEEELWRLGTDNGRGTSGPVSLAEATVHRGGGPLPPDAEAVESCLGVGGATGSLRWATRVADLLQAALAQQGLEAGVVRVPARVEKTGFRVRVHMALDDVDLDVRRSGLDRDPGWVPALGRVVELVNA